MATDISENVPARRTRVRLTINGHDVTDTVSPSLTAFTYTDNLSGKADEITFSLQDREGLWSGSLKPEKGMPVKVSLETLDWLSPGKHVTLDCGSFTIDEVTLDGPPDVFRIKALTSALTTGLRDELKTRAWEHSSLRSVATFVAAEHGMELYYDGPDHPVNRQDQREEGDLAFLARLGRERAMLCKAHNNHLVLVDRAMLEEKEPTYTLSRQKGQATRYSFSQASSDTAYSKAEVNYADPATGLVHSGVAQVKAANAVAKVLRLNQRVESSAEAMRLAESALHNANRQTAKARLDCPGDPALVAGLVVTLTDFGDFSGVYIIDKANHTIDGTGGYSTSIELSKRQLRPDTRPGFGGRLGTAGKEETSSSTPDSDNANDLAGLEAAFEKIRASLRPYTDDFEDIMLCLPEIAAAEAEKRHGADRRGWLYLCSMFHRWFSGQGSNNPLENTLVDGAPFWVDWDWVMSYEKARTEYASFIDPATVQSQIWNEASKQSLGSILALNGFLKNTVTPFTFCEANWQDWEKYYYSSRTVSGSLTSNGLQAALAGFSLRALASGYTEPNSGGGHTIKVNQIAVYVDDRFNFEPDGLPHSIFFYWNCNSKTFSFLPSEGSILLADANFREFRTKHGYGRDFHVLSKQHRVHSFYGDSYVYP